jgi:hypothetical protein
MAYHGELVRMENGRWARFQECSIYREGSSELSELPLLVAVELDEHLQDWLNESKDVEAMYRDGAAPVRLERLPAKGSPVELSFGSALH